MKKRIISICLVAALIFAMLPQTAFYSHAAQLDAVEYEMREEVIEFKLSDGTVFYSNTLRYPYFLGNTAAEININKEYAARIQNCKNNTTDFDARYQEILRWSPNEVSGLPFYDNLTAEVTYCKNGAISIKECSTMWSGGMHPYSYYSGHTYLIAGGSELVLSDILTGSDAQIKNLVDKHKQGVVDYYDAEVIMASPFVLTEDGLCFLCNVGDAVPRAEILIPYSDANSFVISAGHSPEDNNGENSDEKDSYTQKSDEKIRTINAINALLVGVKYYSEQHESDVSKWTDETIRDAIHSKLLWDDYQDSDSSYLSSIGLKYWTGEDWYLHFDLELIQKITQDTFGRDLPISTPVSPSVTTGTVYQSVIDQYLAVLNMDSRTFLKTPDQYWNGDHRAVYYFHRYKSDNFYYACYDIDKNGTDELLVGAGRDAYIAIVDIYGWDGVNVVQIMDESTLGDRSRVLLLEDGTMYHSWSNSADESGEEYFRLNGCTLKEGSASTAAEEDNIEWQVFAGPEYNEKNGISNGNSDNMVVSGGELLISEAIGESTTLSVQNYTQQGDMLIAVGTAIHNYVGFSEFLGYFQAIVKKNPSSVYGYTLVSFGSIAENQQFSKLKASASSELKEVTITHYAENVIDDNLETVWVEGVPGVGKNEWIKLEAKDGSKMDVSAIEFALGYQKNEKLLRNNGWPYKVLIEGEGGYRQEAEFYEYTDAVILDQPITTSWIKITILEADAGAKYEDTCISEIRLRGIDCSTYFEKYLAENPIDTDDFAYEDYARSEWIRQHMEYAASDEYENEIVGGYDKRMMAVFRDALDDEDIKSYETRKAISAILNLDIELSEADMYELIIAEILFGERGQYITEETYNQNLRNSVANVAKVLVNMATSGDTAKEIPADALDSIKESYELLQTLEFGSEEYGTTYSKFISLLKGNVKDLKSKLKAELAGDAAFTGLGIVIDGAFEQYEALEDILSYINNYVAYQSTSKQTQEVLAYLAVNVLYKYDGLYGVDEFIDELGLWDSMTNWADFQTALVSVMKAMAEYEQEGASAIAEYAVEREREAGYKFGAKALKSVTVFVVEKAASCIPVINTILLVKNVANVVVSATVILDQIFTNVDEREYALDILTKAYCISVMLDKTVDDCVDSMSEDDFYSTTVFDESISIYKKNLLFASGYALKYADMVLANAEEELREYDEGWSVDHLFTSRDDLVAAVTWYSNSYKLLEEQQVEIRGITCHDLNLLYDPLTDEIIYNFEDSRIYVVACPVDVIVTTDSGEQIAYLSGEENQIASGYEFYFHTIKLKDDSGEYIKVAIVPNEYQIELKGTDDGVMHAFVADFTIDDVGEVETYFNIPIEKDSVGYFEVVSDDTNESSLVMDQVAYSNMESAEDVSADSGKETTWVWITGSIVVAGAILALILIRRKKSSK